MTTKILFTSELQPKWNDPVLPQPQNQYPIHKSERRRIPHNPIHKNCFWNFIESSWNWTFSLTKPVTVWRLTRTDSSWLDEWRRKSGVVECSRVESNRVNEWNFVAFCSRSSTKHKTKMCIAKTFYVWKIRRGASTILRTSPWIHSQLQLCVGCAVGWMVAFRCSFYTSLIRSFT